MIVRDLDDYLRHIQNNMHPAFIKNIAKEMQEKDKEIERLNSIINKAIKWFDNADRRGLNELLDILKGVDKE